MQIILHKIFFLNSMLNFCKIIFTRKVLCIWYLTYRGHKQTAIPGLGNKIIFIFRWFESFCTIVCLFLINSFLVGHCCGSIFWYSSPYNDKNSHKIQKKYAVCKTKWLHKSEVPFDCIIQVKNSWYGCYFLFSICIQWYIHIVLWLHQHNHCWLLCEWRPVKWSLI